MDYSLDLYTYRVSCMVSGADKMDKECSATWSLLEGQSVSVNDITLSHYGGRENQIQAENPTTEPPATTSTQQSCQPDIHSVLREVSVMLARAVGWSRGHTTHCT
ncbi:hypothetical protein NFI96_000173 [Prochilodus magdalenae]|nr:hypothetical protein NFI96_000173 [Prochilodus magdalenae]